MSTDLSRIGERTRKEPDLAFTSLYHHVTDLDNLRGCYEALDDDKAVGVRKHTDRRWILPYIKRWLKTPVLRGAEGEVPSVYSTKHPEYRLPNTGFFIINITPHRGDGALLTGAPRLI
jgi:hypothetical protein